MSTAVGVALGLERKPITDPVAEYQAIQREFKRRQWRQNPQLWAQERLGIFLWSGQIRIMNAVRDHRKVAVASCHEIGKSFSAALTVAWWIDTNPAGDAFAVSTAPTNPQVRTILWREINRIHSMGKLPGRVNQTEWHLPGKNGKEEIVAFGRKPDDYNPTAFQGIHARRVLFVGDEACGIPGLLLDAADSLCANDNSKVLLIGNPDDPASAFHDACKPGTDYHVLHVGAFDTPNFTGEAVPPILLEVLVGRLYVEEKRKKWAPRWFWVDAQGNRCDSTVGVKVVPPTDADPKRLFETAQPFWFSKVLGQFPEHGTEGGLIPVSWIRRAQERYIQAADGGQLQALLTGCKVCGELSHDAGKEYKHEFAARRNTLGVDVGGGGDSSTIAHSQGQLVKIIHEDHNPDTMATCATVIGKLRETGAAHASIDSIGIGQGVADRARELGEPIIAVNVGTNAFDEEQFVNLKAESYWGLRQEFENEEILLDPLDDDTVSELMGIRFKRVGRGRIQIESKDEAKRRGVPSPNRAEAVMLARGKGGREPGDYGVTI